MIAWDILAISRRKDILVEDMFSLAQNKQTSKFSTLVLSRDVHEIVSVAHLLPIVANYELVGCTSV